MNEHLLSQRTRKDHAAAVAAAAAEVGRFLDGRTTPRSPASPAHLASLTEAVDLSTPLGALDKALLEVRGLYLDHAVGYHHPRYLSHLNCPITIPSLAAETLATSVNTAVETWDQGTSACLIEQKLIDWVADLIDFDRPDRLTPDGVFTTGGSQSNLQALFTAREDRLSRPDPRGTAPGDRGRRLSRLRIVTGEHAHLSVVKSARLLGLAPDAVITLPGEGDRMDPATLDRALSSVADAGDEVAAVVALAGTTDHGAIDPLRAVGEVCRRHDVWLHVDAAYGGGLLVSPTRRDLLDGIGSADSVTVDFHKTFFLPVAASALLLRDGSGFRHSTVSADYLNPADGDDHAVDKSLQTTRRFDALKLWMTLRVLGADGIGRMLDDAIDVARRIGRTIDSADDFELVRRPALSTVLFRPRPEGCDADESDALVRPVRDALFAEGRSVVAATVVDGRPCLKFTVLDPELSDHDVTAVLANVREAARYLADGMRQATSAGVLS
ncbi:MULTISPECIES: pyridoxal-dependent decarboxylase [unclassified Dietzia]|uniref:pyridoxal phosphate-dependent decarboxylase family protein n=1 Tax=unclassified Dietzia TaxID=2617939 RepID=UPI000D21F81B|nr:MULTISPECIES: pyridoxal-dependent decarboxylase [unclassified Dietzia]AVZ39203.1 pyridoxal-dependent decarboxylase [Dietzia sp. JS16-p6b]QGW24428.1 putative amino acid decarboxylase, pyridoxal-dependent protein [Dietzia sp. DQ12-45-1b]